MWGPTQTYLTRYQYTNGSQTQNGSESRPPRFRAIKWETKGPFNEFKGSFSSKANQVIKTCDKFAGKSIENLDLLKLKKEIVHGRIL